MAGDLFGAIELGGTKTIVIVANENNQIIRKIILPTLSPEITINDIVNFFLTSSGELGRKIVRIGVGSFGPLDLHHESKTYGFITSTPKLGWQYFDLKAELEEKIGASIILDTDVNAAAWGEYLNQSNKSIKNLAYITVGTGIGAGLIVNGAITHGLVHPEFGHIRIPQNTKLDPYPGICPFHKNCLEGLASGPAIQDRWRQSPETLPVNHMGWELEAEYLAYAISNLICTISPQLIVLGGGVMRFDKLYTLIREKTKKILNRYIKSEVLEDQTQNYITPPLLKEDSGIMGALYLSKDKL